MGALGWVGRGFGRVGRGMWPCWARWAGLGVGFGCAGRAGLAVLGVLGWARWAGLGADLAVLGAGCGRAGRVGLGWAWGLGALGAPGWLCLACWAGRAGLGWAWGLAVLVLGWVGRRFWLLRFCVIVAETNVTVFCSLSAFRHQYA